MSLLTDILKGVLPGVWHPLLESPKPTNNMTTFHTKGQFHPINNMEAAKKLDQEAAKYAGLKPGFDIDEEKYYQSQKVDKYNAYIAGYVSALTTPVTENNEEDVFAQTEVYLGEQL